jgi:uncharacterized protein (TIGR02271 family)
LVASKTRRKSGEIAIGKRVETETQQVSVPIEKERVVIERKPVSSTAVVSGEAAFQEGEVAHVEVYEETPDIRKEAFVREEVQVKKVVDQEVVTAEEKIRREASVLLGNELYLGISTKFEKSFKAILGLRIEICQN